MSEFQYGTIIGALIAITGVVVGRFIQYMLDTYIRK